MTQPERISPSASCALLLLTVARLGDECAREVGRVERAQVLEPLPYADQLDRQADLVGDCDRDAALRRAVQLRQRDAGDSRGLAEQTRLLEPVLAGRRVDD